MCHFPDRDLDRRICLHAECFAMHAAVEAARVVRRLRGLRG